MNELRCTLITDGPSDRALIPHLKWLLNQNGIDLPISFQWSELRHLRKVPRSLSDKIEKTLELYPCDILFIHKDAERDDPLAKKQEVMTAVGKINFPTGLPPIVCLVPVRMHEAWLLFNESAIRRASGNPNGRVQLDLPKLKTVENLPDPKEILYELLRTASGRAGRRLKQLNVQHSASQISQFIDDFSPLRILKAFQRLETELSETIKRSKENNST
jgi:hypothetical protein